MRLEPSIQFPVWKNGLPVAGRVRRVLLEEQRFAKLVDSFLDVQSYFRQEGRGSGLLSHQTIVINDVQGFGNMRLRLVPLAKAPLH